MKKMKKLFALILAFTFAISLFRCGGQTDGSSVQTVYDEDNLRERKNIFASYFDHDIDYKIGVVQDSYFVIKTDDGEIFKFTDLNHDGYDYPTPEENYALKSESGPIGSLEHDDSFYLEGEKLIVFYTKGENGLNYYKSRSPIAISETYTHRFPSVPGENRFGDETPREYFINRGKEIREKLDNMTDLKVLTLEEAVDVFFENSQYDKEDFVLKKAADGRPYWHDEENGIAMCPNIAIAVNPGVHGSYYNDTSTCCFFILVCDSEGRLDDRCTCKVYLDGTIKYYKQPRFNVDE